MSGSADWDRVRSTLEDVVGRPEAERAACIEAISDVALRAEVASLLRAHDSAGDFLEAAPAFGEDPAAAEAAPAPVLQPGTRLGSFEILAPLGAGGMGQVYRARDTRLDRAVAIKVIAPDLAHSRVSRERFEREARAISQLAHPHVCVLHDVGLADLGQTGEHQFLVMELVEGPTLRERLDRGALPLRQALEYGIQMADALVAAHGLGIVHRDLKPANIVVTKSGVKLLDFGLASFQRRPDSPPLADGQRRASVGGGVIAGTLPYMAPEQLQGAAADARSDIFSFGAVLYEMVTGRRAFEGQSQSSLVSAILGAPYPSGSLTPRALDAVVEVCLAKDPDHRWSNIHDVRLQLQSILKEVASPTVEAVRRPPALWLRTAPWALAAISGIGWLLAVGHGPPEEGPPPVAPQRHSVELGMSGSLALTDATVALSPDGSLLAFAARGTSDVAMLYVRRLDQLTATLLPGTEGASSPCFSRDGQWVGFFADGKLRKVPVTGGAVVTLADAPNPRGMWWADDGGIVFTATNRAALARVSSVGGPTQPLTKLASGEISHRFAQVLPGGTGVLYTASTEINIGTGSTVMVQPLPSGSPKVVARGAYFGRYVPSGHILYLQDDTLFAVPFDATRLVVTGPAARTADAIESDATRGAAHLAVSDVGTMAYLQGRNKFDARPIAWLDRTGRLTTLRAQPGEWKNAEFSPDGRRIAMDMRMDGQSDIWVYDWERDALTRVTSESTNEEFPVWTPDGTRIAYRSFKSAVDAAGYTIAWKRADGSGQAQVLVHAPIQLQPESFHPTRRVLAYVASTRGSAEDVMILPIDGDEARGWTPTRSMPLLTTAASEQSPAFSPDGRWLSYSTTEAGARQVFVQPFPGPGPRVMVSTAVGELASWSRSRSELVFTVPGIDYQRTLMVAGYRLEHGSFSVDRARPWTERAVFLRNVYGDRTFALHRDGLRVAIAPPSERETAARTHVTLVSNLFDHLRAIAPPTP